MTTLLAVLAILCSYLLGAVPFGLLIARWRAGIDIRQHGSGNVGATNVVRVLGKPAGYLAFGCDVFKGLVPVLIAKALQLPAGFDLPLACGIAAIAGHVFPVYLRFRGGKGVATTFGAFLGLAPLATLITGAVWLVLFKLTRVVAVASLGLALAFPLSIYLVDPEEALDENRGIFVTSIVLATLIILRHRANISRLFKGEELGFGRKEPRIK
jgi:glycerol-3-phosphate acyltransferase PlsY